MARLEDLTRGTTVKGIFPGPLVTIVDVQWHGTSAVEVTYKDPAGRPGNQLLFRDDEARLEIATEGKPWSFDADGNLLRLVSEAQRIRLAYLFDPYLAVHTSDIQPLPHQITAVYENMLPRQPLRFLLADDPGAGKTIMAGLYIKELIARGDLQRCLIVCPGSLVEQWQDELYRRFHLSFDILTRDRIETARTGNAFAETPLLIARLDQLARNDDLQGKLAQVDDWDLVVVDEAHKMSASYFGGEINYTKRYHLGRRLGELARHFLLMTATPHNGKEEDFQLFMALLDGDRFEGRFRDGAHTVDVSDLMRRMVKERLLTFEARPLFPERRAYTVPYRLSPMEARLYNAVTTYVREEFNRAEALQNDGRKGTVGFALTILQRRLASSPEAIYQSLKRRRERLESRLREMDLLARGQRPDRPSWMRFVIQEEDWEDLDEAPADEMEDLEEELIDQATAAGTVQELRAEIAILRGLEALAQTVRNSGEDRKWEELRRLLLDKEAMFDAGGRRRKLVIFSEHRDTVAYLLGRIRTLLGRTEAVVTIHGGMGRDERRTVQELFTQDKTIEVLVATDAAGEGINLQRAHLMINYDLPWNPNRLEQRFGRIHRIGQTEVCHLWNLLAEGTREGDVYLTLLRKLERERETLGGAVFDVLGKAIDGQSLRRLMIDAIRYGERPEVRARLTQTVEGALDHEHLKALIDDHALTTDVMSVANIQAIREEMERMEARRLQPHFIASYFKAAFANLGGTLRERETGRFEITHVPAVIRQRGRQIGLSAPVLTRYERICFERALVYLPGKPQAAFICPGHPLLDAVTDLVLERYRDLMKQGAILVDEQDQGEALRALLYLEHSIQDARTGEDGGRRVVSRRLQFVEAENLNAEAQRREGSDSDPFASSRLRVKNPNAEAQRREGSDSDIFASSRLRVENLRFRDAGYAPYLDYRPAGDDEKALLRAAIDSALTTHDLESQATSYAIAHLVQRHLSEVRQVRLPLIDKTLAAVKDRLTKEITYWDRRALDLQTQEEAGTGRARNARMNSTRARQRRDDLQARLQKRLAELEQERQLAALPPAVIGGALVAPAGLLARLRGERQSGPGLFARETRRVELAAMEAVMAAERALGYTPRDVSAGNVGYDIESQGREDGDGSLRMIEVKGRIRGAGTVTVTRNEIVTALNTPNQWILALVEVPPTEELPQDVAAALTREPGPEWVTGAGCQVRYLRRPFSVEPDFAAVSVNYDWSKLWNAGKLPW